MNITELIALTSNVLEHLVLKEVRNTLSHVKSLLFTTKLYYGYISKVFGHLWSLGGHIAHIGYIFVCIALFIVFFSFLKSLAPRYNYRCIERRFENDKVNLFQGRETKSNSRICSADPKQKDSTGRECSVKNQSILQRFVSHVRNEYRNVKLICSTSLTESNVHSAFRQLSWSYTQIDLERVDWLNQTIKTLWPSIKIVLNRFVLKDLVKSRTSKEKLLQKESKNLAKSKVKLSLYLAVRKRIGFLRDITNLNKNEKRTLVDKGFWTMLLYIIKLIMIYIRQFIMDHLVKIFQSPSKIVDDKKRTQIAIDVEKLLTMSSLKTTKGNYFASKSWAGFDLETGKRDKLLKVKKTNRKSSSAPGRLAIKSSKGVVITTSQFLGSKTMADLKKRRQNLAKQFKRKYDIGKKEISIQRIRLGNSTPTLNGVKYVEENNDFFATEDRYAKHLKPSDENNMRFVLEISYRSDREFCIQVKSLPVIDCIRLTKCEFQFRFLLTLNHTAAELNKNLDIFYTPDNTLFPVINYAQLTLIDLPRIDWNFDKPRAKKMKQNFNLKNHGTEKRRPFSLIYSKLRKYVEPMQLINNLYFKYLFHMVVYLLLKWLQPFDIKLSPYFYVKTTC